MRQEKDNIIKKAKIIAKCKLAEKYFIDNKQYKIKIINEILFNDNTHLVTRFKDYLIYDDNNEFISKNFELKEIYVLFPFILEYYINYSKIVPWFIPNKEGKIIFRNYQRKQKFFLSKHKIKAKENHKLSKENSVFYISQYLKSFLQEKQMSLIKLKNSHDEKSKLIEIKNSVENKFIEDNQSIKEHSIILESFTQSNLNKLNFSDLSKLSKIDSLYEFESVTERQTKVTFEDFNEINIFGKKLNGFKHNNKKTNNNVNNNYNHNQNLKSGGHFNNQAKNYPKNEIIQKINNNQNQADKENNNNNNNNHSKMNKGKLYINSSINFKKNFLLGKNKENGFLLEKLKNKKNENNFKTLTNNAIKSVNKNTLSINDKLNRNKIINISADSNNKTKNLNRFCKLQKTISTNLQLIESNSTKTSPIKDKSNKNNCKYNFLKTQKQIKICRKNDTQYDQYNNCCLKIFSDTKNNEKDSNKITFNKNINKNKYLLFSDKFKSEKGIENKQEIFINKFNIREGNFFTKNRCLSINKSESKSAKQQSNNLSSKNLSSYKVHQIANNEDKKSRSKNTVSKLNEYAKKIDFIMKTVKKLSRNFKKENKENNLQLANSKNKNSLRINSNSKSSNINNMFSTNSNTANSERTQMNNISGYFDKKILSEHRSKLMLNLYKQEDGLNTDRVNFDKKLYENLKIEMINTDFFDNKNIVNGNQHVFNKGITYNVILIFISLNL